MTEDGIWARVGHAAHPRNRGCTAKIHRMVGVTLSNDQWVTACGMVYGSCDVVDPEVLDAECGNCLKRGES